MNTLTSTTGIIARIFELPGREPFMLAADLAEAYGTQTDRVTEQVRRNPDRFPEDFAFRLSEKELEVLKPQNAVSNKANRALPLVFTHAGALALSGVLKTPVAAEVSVIIHRTFAAMEKRALADTRFMLAKLRADHLAKKPIYVRIQQAKASGWTLDELFRSSSYSRWRLEQAMQEMLAMHLLDAPLSSDQADLFGMDGHGA